MKRLGWIALLPFLVAAPCSEEPPPPNPCEVNPDVDADGHRRLECGGMDCDDTDAGRYPARMEICDGAGYDEDCDPNTFGTRDSDSDGHVDWTCSNVDPGGVRRGGDDCDDSNQGIHPGVPEVCNGRDDNCNGTSDEGVVLDFFQDGDLDGHGTGVPIRGCFLVAGYSTLGNDCEDKNAAIRPGSMICGATTSAYQICQPNGTYLDGTCPAVGAGPGICTEQPNGLGYCQ